MKKIRVGILFGGKSAEHEVSVRSAKSIYEALDKEKYDVHLIGISRNGEFISLPRQFLHSSPQEIGEKSENQSVSTSAQEKRMQIGETIGEFDMVFPVLHGPYGEDGTVQGLLKLLNIPFVGAGVLGSAVGMDKDVMKRLLRDAGVPITQFLVFTRGQAIPTDIVIKKLGLPLFVKPANLGSSVGVSKVTSQASFQKAVDEAFQFDNKIIIEEYIKGKELEVSVLGNDTPRVSVVGEIIPTHEFYSYEAKYIDEHGAKYIIPAQIHKKKTEEIQELAIKTFQTLACADFARVDFFLSENGKVYVNEINTIPGFTSISMYPKLWEASGIGYTDLIDQLIQLAIVRYNTDQRLKTSYQS